jgi:hypothetical protein
MTGRLVYLGEDAIFSAKPSIRFAAETHRQTGFDFLPLTDPPKIKCVGWISGKGV